MKLIALFLIFCIISFYLYFLFKRNKKSSSDSDSYYLYDNKLSLPLLALTVIATQVGGGMIVGVADASYQVGFFGGLLYPLGSLLGLLIIAFIFGGCLKKSGVPTISAVFEKKYKFPFARRVASLISSFSLFAIMVAQGVAIKSLLSANGVNHQLLLIVIWLAVILYTSVGGIKAVVKTNVLQVSLISIALFTLLFFVTGNADIKQVNLSRDINYLRLLEWFIWPCCYMLIEQDMAQLFFSAKSTKAVKWASILAALGILIAASIPALVGAIAQNYNIGSNNGVLLFYAKNYLTPPMYGITVGAIIIAITSTIDSLLCAISSNIAYDFNLNKLSAKLLSLLTLAVGLGSLIVVFFYENVINVLMFSYSICVSTMFVPSVLGFLLPESRLNKTAVVLSFVFGLVSIILLILVKSSFTYCAILFSALGYSLPYACKKIIIYK